MVKCGVTLILMHRKLAHLAAMWKRFLALAHGRRGRRISLVDSYSSFPSDAVHVSYSSKLHVDRSHFRTRQHCIVPIQFQEAVL